MTNAPPWIQNRTGRCASSSAGVKTLSVRQPASSTTGSAAPIIVSSIDGFCGATGPKRVGVAHARPRLDRCGGRKRSAPTGGAAYGIERNT